jgi:hypothetical protein
VLGEDDDLAAVAVRIKHFGLSCSNLRQLAPLLVVAAVVERRRFCFQRAQDQDFGFHLDDGVGGAGLVHRLVGDVLVFFGDSSSSASSRSSGTSSFRLTCRIRRGDFRAARCRGRSVSVSSRRASSRLRRR